jgi:hypothetical protein
MFRRLLVLPAAASLLAISLTAANAFATSWTQEPVPQPPGGVGASLSSVSCASADDCIAVGSATGAVAESWDGTAWSVMSLSQPPDKDGVMLNSVSCVSADYCMAVGQDAATTGQKTQQTLTELWNGSTWTIEPTPLPFKSQQAHVLSSVSCASTTYCVAGGLDYVNTKKGYYWFIDLWNGSAWTVEATFAGLNLFDSTGVSCPTTAGCYLTDGDQIAYWSGGDSVTTSDLVSPASGTDVAASGISCTTAESCTIVGFSRSHTTDINEPLAEYWDGSSWVIQPTHLPANASKGTGGDLAAVSCTSAAYCTAVGSYTPKGATFSAQLIERWTPGTPGQWGIPFVKDPSTSLNGLYGVSCTTTVNCNAVGNYYDEGYQGLSEVLAPTS